MKKARRNASQFLGRHLREQWFNNGFATIGAHVTFDRNTALRPCFIDQNDREITASQTITISHKMIPKRGIFAKFSSKNPHLIPLFFKHLGIKMSHRLQTTTSKGITKYYYLFRLN